MMIQRAHRSHSNRHPCESGDDGVVVLRFKRQFTLAVLKEVP
jgi:hypothetical protein